MSYHHYHKYPNLIKDHQQLTKRNQIIVTDITYIRLTDKNEFCYLFLITDMYSRKITGYCLHENLSREGALKSLKMHIKNSGIKELKNCIHHSDRGVQYCCHEYVAALSKLGIRISMTENGDPLENPIAERINKTIKEEFTEEKTLTYPNIDIAKKEIKKIIAFYNNERPNSSIERLTPEDAHKKTGTLQRHWKPYYKTKEQLFAENEML